MKSSGFKPLSGHCVVFLGKTLYSHSASRHPGVNGYQQTFRMLGGGLASHPGASHPRRSSNTPSRFMLQKPRQALTVMGL